MHAREWSGFLVSLDMYRVDTTVLRSSTGTDHKFGHFRWTRPVRIQFHQFPRTQQSCSDTWQVVE